MKSLPIFGVLVVMTPSLCRGHEQGNAFEEFQQHHHENEVHRAEIHHNFDSVDHQQVIDDRHLEEHLSKERYLNPKEMSDSEKQYHLFRAHDYDQDEELDGTEIMQAFFHGENVPIYTEKELAEKIDYLLDNYDSNRNGKLSFGEFMVSSARFSG